MNTFLNQLKHAAEAPVEPEPAARSRSWDSVLNTFIAFLNERYADALRAFCNDRDASGIVQIMVNPRGRRNHRSTLLVFRFTRSGVRIVGENGYEIESTSALEQRLTELVRTEAFRSKVEAMRALANEPVIGVLHAGGLLDRRPSTDVLVTISADEQARLAAASEATPRQSITLHARLAGTSPAGQGTYAPGAALRWLVAGGYGLALDPDGHVLEGEDLVRLTGMPVDPAALEEAAHGRNGTMRAADKYDVDPYFQELSQRFQRNVRHLRTGLNLTLEQAAMRAGIHWRHWQKIEAGDNNVTLQTLTRVANCLGAELNELLGSELPSVRGKPNPKRWRRARKKA